MKRIIIKLIELYQCTPLSVHSHCRYTPTCSQYMKEAVEEYGILKGVYLGIKRIIRCNPFGKYGYDPVPIKNHKKTNKKCYNENGDNMKNKIFNTLKFVIGLVTIILVLVFQKDLGISGIIGGIGVILYGICSFITGNKMGYLFTGLGISLELSILLYKFKVLPEVEAITFFICLSMIFVVLLSFIFEYFNEKQFLKVHNKEIEAFVVDLIRNPNTNNEYYQPIYEYEINGDTLVVGLPGYLEKDIPKIGDKAIIYVNPNDSTDVYFKKSKKDKIYMLAVNLFLLIASIIIIITLF